MTHARRATEGDTQSLRYLSELNTTVAKVQAWDAGGRSLDDDAMVMSLNQFIDESVVRPNAAMRPVWASSGQPHYMLLWHLEILPLRLRQGGHGWCHA